MKVNLLDFDLQGLVAHSATMGERAFRAEQLMRWIHQAGEDDFGKMTDLAKSFRAKLVETAEVAPLPIISDTTAADGTRKSQPLPLAALPPGQGTRIDRLA